MPVISVDLFLCFFFSSRRRHTRCYRDWSSDVCSSDLGGCRQRRPVPPFRRGQQDHGGSDPGRCRAIPLMRIDFHAHMGVYTFHNPWVTEWMKETHPEGYEEYIRKYDDPGAFEELLAAEGVDHACVLAELSDSTTGLCTNEQVRDFCRGRRRLFPFCDISPNRFTHLVVELGRRVVDGGFRGVKPHPSYQQYYPTEQRMYPLYQAAQDLGVPVMFHVGSSVFRGTRMKYCDPLHLDDGAGDFPEVTIV